MSRNKAIAISVVIILITIIAGFYILNSEKKPVAPSANQAFVASEKQPSKILKEYSDDAGFSFQYPIDVQINKKDIANDTTAYANLAISSSQAKGSISIKVLDTAFKSIDGWFLENKLTAAKEIKIGAISGKEANMSNKITSAGLDQGVLFVIEVDMQDQKYWQSVYDTILSTFNFVVAESSVPETQSLDESSDDAILEEEISE